MRLRKLLFLPIILLLLYGCSEKEGAAYVEGLLYLDGKAVKVEILDGIITRVESLKNVSDFPEVYLAPGLIDIQINGYMGVDFSDQDLSPDHDA